MRSKRVMSLCLVLLLAALQPLSTVSAYAEAVQEQEVATAPATASEEVPATEDDSAAAESAVDDEEVSGEAAEPADAAQTDPVSVDASAAEFVYVDRSVVALGSEQSVVVALSALQAPLASARLELADQNGAVSSYEATKIDGSAVRFTMTFTGEEQIATYHVQRLVYSLEGDQAEYAMTFPFDAGGAAQRSFDVVRADTAEALSQSTENDGVTAMAVQEDGTLVAADSIEDAIDKADSEGVEDSIENATPAGANAGIMMLSARSAISSTREDYLIVAIDPGHGGRDGGAQGFGLSENNLTWSIANHLKDELSTYTGVTPYLTTNGDNPSLQERVDRAARVGADVFVSVHINSSASGAALGAEVWVPNDSSYNYTTHLVGKDLGEKIENQLVALGLNRRGVFTRDYPAGEGSNSTYADGSTSDYYGVIRNARRAGIPGIIVEHAFISNAGDANKLRDDNMRKRMGIADATGIAQQYNLGRDSAAKAAASVAVNAHISNLGWLSTVYDQKVAGTTGKNFNLEAFQASLQNGAASKGGITYRASVDGSWQGWQSNGGTAGVAGQGKTMQAVEMKLTGDAANAYDVYYRAYVSNIGWLGWAKDGQTSGTQGYGYSIQAIEVAVVEKGAAAPGKTDDVFRALPENSVAMHRLYNPYTGEHFYTAETKERDSLVKEGWRSEGVGWVAPKSSGAPVYRLYNSYAPGGDHHYTTDAHERDVLVQKGWTDEGIGWYSDDAKGVPLYRQYNPYAQTGTHNYTADKHENDELVKKGWREEGIAWYGVK